MRLPWGNLSDIANTYLGNGDFTILGCLSSEVRCCIVSEQLSSRHNCLAVELIEIIDPPDAFPNYSIEIRNKVEENRRRLNENGINFKSAVTELLATEDTLLDILDNSETLKISPTTILDITSLPKRYFCFFIKRMLLLEAFQNVVVTYTQTSTDGYTHGHLAEDPMSCDHLPGYAGLLPPKGNTLVISVGFESLSIRSLLEVYSDKRRDMKILFPFPPNGRSIKRGWNTLRQIASGNPKNINRDNLVVVAAWDTEEIYQTLVRWSQNSEGLTLAPFGPKPHSLGMALFAIKNDAGIYYTQPKSYNPDYSTGYGISWAYVIKWEGIPCYDRLSKQL